MIDTSLWSEEFRPETLNDVIGQPAVAVLQAFIRHKNVVDINLIGPPGVGKTSAILAMVKELYGLEHYENNFKILNASDERGIDVVRTQIKNFTFQGTTNPEVPFLVMYLDEADGLCLDGNTEILTGYEVSMERRKFIKLKDLHSLQNIPIPSFNIKTNEIENDNGYLITSKEQEFFRITLENGKEIIASAEHPFFRKDKGENIVEIKTKELSTENYILDFQEDLNIIPCENCGKLTPKKRFCSRECANKGHSKDMLGEGNPRFGENAWNKGKTIADDIRIAKQGHPGESNVSKRPEVKTKKHESLRKFYLTDEGKALIKKKSEDLSVLKKGKTFSELFPNLTPEQLEERRKQSSSTYRNNGIFKDSNYRKEIKNLSEIQCCKCNKIIKVGGNNGIYIHHKDENRDNNVKENLECVCPRCHNLVCHDRMTTFLEKGWEKLRGNHERS